MSACTGGLYSSGRASGIDLLRVRQTPWQPRTTIQGPGVNKEHTPVINGGKKATLKVKLTAGEYDFYCSVPGHYPPMGGKLTIK